MLIVLLKCGRAGTPEDSQMNPDQSPVPNSGTLDVVLEHYAFPGELPDLASLARRFLVSSGHGGWTDQQDQNDCDALYQAINPLLNAVEKLLGKPIDDSDRCLEPWPRMIDLACESLFFADSIIALWREVAELSVDELQELLDAARPSCN